MTDLVLTISAPIANAAGTSVEVAAIAVCIVGALAIATVAHKILNA